MPDLKPVEGSYYWIELFGRPPQEPPDRSFR